MARKPRDAVLMDREPPRRDGLITDNSDGDGAAQRAQEAQQPDSVRRAGVANVAPIPSVVTRGAAPSSICCSSSGSVARVMLAKTTAARTVSTQHSAQRAAAAAGAAATGACPPASTLGDTVWRWESIDAARASMACKQRRLFWYADLTCAAAGLRCRSETRPRSAAVR